MLYLVYMWANVLPYVGFLSRVWLQNEAPHIYHENIKNYTDGSSYSYSCPPAAARGRRPALFDKSVSSLDWKQLQVLQESTIWTRPYDHIDWWRRYYISLVDTLQLVVVESCRSQVSGTEEKKTKKRREVPYKRSGCTKIVCESWSK
jgi:hypothetical protein